MFNFNKLSCIAERMAFKSPGTVVFCVRPILNVAACNGFDFVLINVHDGTPPSDYILHRQTLLNALKGCIYVDPSNVFK